jgi:ATP-dependent exoDNAse (exonuclease V) alpha subunit
MELDELDEQQAGEQQEIDLGVKSGDINFGSVMDIDISDNAGEHDRMTPCCCIFGSAGTGKTTEIRRRIDEDPNYAVLSASTGISAINLSAVTIHSLLGFFDTDSLRDAYLQGSAQRRLRKIADEGYKNVVLDEISMISKETLDLLVKIFDDVNLNLPASHATIGMTLVGDFGQLPPIADRAPGKKASHVTPWAFDAISWKRFEPNITRLTKVWRQADPKFLAALNHARRGEGEGVVAALDSSGIEYHSSTDTEFDGTTIVSKNDEVDRHNNIALDRVKGRLMALPSARWGQQRTEWKNIPEKTLVRENAYVMILSNKRMEGGTNEFYYVNGDCGHVRGVQTNGQGVPPSILVELIRNGQLVAVNPVVRGSEFKDKPDGVTIDVKISSSNDDGSYIAQPHYRGKVQKYITGQVMYYPIRLGYASTVHKCQGLSMDRCQIDFTSWMFGQAAMLYVAMSRARTIEGMRIRGMREHIITKCKCDPRIISWL